MAVCEPDSEIRKTAEISRKAIREDQNPMTSSQFELIPAYRFEALRFSSSTWERDSEEFPREILTLLEWFRSVTKGMCL